ncbi:MAG: hypothetical protein V3W32_05855 [Gemmatimonadota bacterium]
MAQEILIVPEGHAIFFLEYPAAPVLLGGVAVILTNSSSALPESALAYLEPGTTANIDGGLVAWEEQAIPNTLADNDAVDAWLQLKWAAWADRMRSNITGRAIKASRARWVEAR